MLPPFSNNNNQNWQNQNSNQLKWQQALNQNSPNGAGGYPYDPYQVKQSDTFDSIAKNTGFDVPAIQQANVGMLVPPPKGSFINVPKPPEQYVGQGTYIPQQPSPVYGPPRPQNLGTGVIPSGYGLSAAPPEYVAQVQANINQQVASGSMPKVVPLNTPILNPQTGQPVTPAQMVANGYILKEQQWVLSGAATTGPATLPGGQGGASTAGNTDFTNTGFMQKYAEKGTALTEQKRWDPDRKKFVKIGQLIREGKLDVRTGRMGRARRGGGGKQQVASVGPEGTRSGPTERLNTNQGGG